MAAHVTLQDIDEDNFERFMDMELPEHQRDYLDEEGGMIAEIIPSRLADQQIQGSRST